MTADETEVKVHKHVHVGTYTIVEYIYLVQLRNYFKKYVKSDSLRSCNSIGKELMPTENSARLYQPTPLSLQSTNDTLLK